MSDIEKIQMFEGRKVRMAWSEEEQEWFFSNVDVCWILADSKYYKTARKDYKTARKDYKTARKDYKTARKYYKTACKYWNKLKKRLVEEGNELVTNCYQLKLVSPADGKRYLTDVATMSKFASC